MNSFHSNDIRASISCIFLEDNTSSVSLWELAYAFLTSKGIAAPTYRIAGDGSRRHHRDILKELPPEEIRHELVQSPNSGFTIQDSIGIQPQIMDYHKMPLNGGLQRLLITSRDLVKLPDSWYDMVSDLSSIVTLVTAKAQFSTYTDWQCCEDIERYVRHFGSTEHFKHYEKGDPPVNRMVLDTSTNPGRNQIKNGCPMGVSAEMWLGPAFWRFAPCKKQDILATDFLMEVRDTPDFLYLRGWPHPFTRPDGEQGRIQQKLWRLLFHEDCEWPPSSGGISDEPVGGPLELMPP